MYSIYLLGPNLKHLFQFVDSKLTQRILSQARRQQQELEDEVGTLEGGQKQSRVSLGDEQSDHSEHSDVETDNADYGNPVSNFQSTTTNFQLASIFTYSICKYSFTQFLTTKDRLEIYSLALPGFVLNKSLVG